MMTSYIPTFIMPDDVISYLYHVSLPDSSSLATFPPLILPTTQTLLFSSSQKNNFVFLYPIKTAELYNRQ